MPATCRKRRKRHEQDKTRHVDLRAAVGSDDEPSLARAPLRRAGPHRPGAAPLRRALCRHQRRAPFPHLALFLLRALECYHHLVGSQRHAWRSHLRNPGERLADVPRLRALPPRKTLSEGHPALYFPGSGLDCMGEMVSAERADFLALAGAGECLRAEHPQHPVV